MQMLAFSSASSEYHSATPPLTPLHCVQPIKPTLINLTFTPKSYREHNVSPSDTLTGICLRYRTTKQELRRLNNFLGDHFMALDVLIVPNRGKNLPVDSSVDNTERIVNSLKKITEMKDFRSSDDDIQHLFLSRRLSKEIGIAESRAADCLDSFDWDYNLAITSCRKEQRIVFKDVKLVSHAKNRPSNEGRVFIQNSIKRFLKGKCSGSSNCKVEIELKDIVKPARRREPNQQFP
mmetsp:Transcript_19243/g.27061  ORF Transcript_19243/g.27061 Transcript_19243/m.27061 type:complete len:235 (-) Transcript_19243:149-853(-)